MVEYIQLVLSFQNEIFIDVSDLKTSQSKKNISHGFCPDVSITKEKVINKVGK